MNTPILKVYTRWFMTASLTLSMLIACGGGGGGSSPQTTNSAPVARLTANSTAVLGDVVTVSGTTSSDADGDAIAYSWSLTSQPAASSISLALSNSASVSFTPLVLGTYSVRLLVSDPTGKTDQVSITINAVNNSAPVANAGADQTAVQNSIVVLNGAASSDANGDALSYAWTLTNKPAQSSAVLSNGTSSTTSFVADAIGDYTLSLVVTDSRGASSVADIVRVTTGANPLTTACGSTACSAISSSQYSGSGLGAWRYQNNSASSASINIDISNVPAGKKVGLFFSNAQTTAATTLPSAGTNASLEPQADTLSAGSVDLKALMSRNSGGVAEAHLHSKHTSAHDQMIQRNARLKAQLVQGQQISPRAEATIAALAPRPAPTVGATRNWVDYFPSTPLTYATTNKFVCSLPSGRSAVFWQQDADTNLTSALLTRFTNAACGNNGGFARITSLLGDAWGSHSFTNLISDTATSKQDINIVFLNPGATADWAGYFYGLNNFISTASQPTNQALAFFINTSALSNPGAVDFYISTLFHEATHMHNFYQNDIVRDKTLQIWMEEMHAVMSEDIVTPSVNGGYNKLIQARIPGYLAARGGVDLINWPTTLGSNSSSYYGMAAAFGGYLNRQYGIDVFQQLTSACTAGLAKTNSYECLRTVLTANGSPGLAEDFSRMNVSVHGLLGSTGNPAGFGYPSKVTGGYTLDTIDLSSRPWDTTAATSLSTSFKPTTQWYVRDVQATGKTRYIRNNVLIPAQTTLHVLIKD